MVACCWIGVGAAAISMVFATSWGEFGSLLGFGLIVGGLPFLLRLGLPVLIAKGFSAVFGGLFLVLMSMWPATLEPRQLYWFGILPLAGGLIFGRRGIQIGGLSSVLLVFGVVYAHQSGLSLGVVAESTIASVVSDSAVFVVSIMIIASVYERLYSGALSQVEASMAARATFLAQMSHELRTPMNGVLGIVDVIDLDAPRAQQQEMLSIIRRSGQAMVALIDELLDQAKLDAGHLQLSPCAFSPHDVVDDVCQLFQAKAQIKQLVLESTVDASTPQSIYADKLRFRQIIQNLLSNAIKFTSKGTVTLTLSWADSTLYGEVNDTGIGMTSAQMEKLFRPFEQATAETASLYGGTGLGLVISRSLCILMGGDLTVTSVYGQGSRFTYSFTAPVAELQAAHGELSAHALFRGRVLIVEDNQINQHVSQQMCERLGLDVDIVEDGIKALEAIETSDYTVVLMDCRMPRMDGFEATRQIRTLPPPRCDLPVIALTASVTAEDREMCRRSGMNDVLPKPLNVDALISALRKHHVQPNSPGAVESTT